jgi:oligoribonuclease NrnB/cAMP/cGMP phosphodiesterase (DHH superfamily)
MKESVEEKIELAQNCTTKFFDDACALMNAVLSSEQEEAVKRITKTNDRLKIFWENNFEKIRKEALAEHCFELFECLEMMLVNIDKASELRKSYEAFMAAGNELRPHLN